MTSIHIYDPATPDTALPELPPLPIGALVVGALQPAPGGSRPAPARATSPCPTPSSIDLQFARQQAEPAGHHPVGAAVRQRRDQPARTRASDGPETWYRTRRSATTASPSRPTPTSRPHRPASSRPGEPSCPTVKPSRPSPASDQPSGSTLTPRSAARCPSCTAMATTWPERPGREPERLRCGHSSTTQPRHRRRRSRPGPRCMRQHRESWVRSRRRATAMAIFTLGIDPAAVVRPGGATRTDTAVPGLGDGHPPARPATTHSPTR